MKKKYFMKGTDDELQFGDIIELDLVGEEDGVTKHSHVELEFLPEFVDELLEDEVIEEKEAEEDLLDFEDSSLEPIIGKLEELDNRLGNLEAMTKALKATVMNIQKSLKKEAPKK